MLPENNITGKWSLEDGYVDQGFNSYPLRTTFSSAKNAFSIFLQNFVHNSDQVCRGLQQGFKVNH